MMPAVVSTAPSWRARGCTMAVRLLVRRRSWGTERALTRRARALFGAPRVWQWLRTRNVTIVAARDGAVAGEWIEPARAQPGTILYIHGGGFVSGSPAAYRPITAALARASQYRVFAVDYRRAPEHRCPAALDDCVAAYLWLLAQSIPARSIALAGDSAGGGLVLSTLVRLRDLGHTLPACAVCFSPWTDLAGTGASVIGNDGRCAMFRPRNVAEFATVYLGGRAADDAEASPVNADLRGLPPLLIQVDASELLLDDARRVHQRARAAGGECHLHVFNGLFHVWQMLAGILPEADAALAEAAGFVRGHVAPSS